MPRVKRGTSHVKRRKNILKAAKGYMWGRKSKMKSAKVAVLKAGVHAYRDRRKKKSDMRALWNIRINAAVRPHGMSYSKFIHALKTNNIELDRKVLAMLASEHPTAFEEIVKKVKA